MRKFKYHEQKLLKKVSPYAYKTDTTLRENEIMKRYHIEKREEYHYYNKLSGQVRSLAAKLQALDPADPFRIKMTDDMLNKLYDLGVIDTKESLSQLANLNPSAFCRRRFPVVAKKLKFCETLEEAVRFVEQAHLRVGPEVITDPAFLVTRKNQDFITWVDSSKLKRKIKTFNNEADDFDLLQA